jgi:hypothetical protein
LQKKRQIKKKELVQFNQMRSMFAHWLSVLIQVDVVEEIVENKDFDIEVILLVQQLVEYLIILYNCHELLSFSLDVYIYLRPIEKGEGIGL